MSQTILGGDFTVYFTNDVSNDGDKQIRWTGSASGTRTVNELYSALMDLFDNVTGGAGDFMDEGVPMEAVTPTQYIIGEIETNDNEPWFIDPETIRHLTGGAIDSAGWTRTETVDIGIIKVAYSVGAGTDFIDTDIGLPVTTSTDGDDGILLAFESDGSTGEAWIRPDTNAISDSFDANPTASDTITVTGGTGTVTQDSASTTGEQIWANVFTLGTIADNTRIYVAQGNVEIENFWGDGQIDRLFLIQDQDTLLGNGLLTVYARQFSKTYDHFITDVSAGGRNPVALGTGDDLNNENGYRNVSVSGASSAFSVDELVTGGTSGAEGIVTANTGSPTTSFEYYLVGDTTIDFTNGETLTGSIVGANGTAGTPTNVGPATFSDVTVTFGANETFDVDQDTVTEDYSIVINTNSRPLSEVYERLKYITRRGSTTSLNGIEGQQYIGTDRRIDYGSLTGTINTGDTVTQVNSGATSVVVAHNTTANFLMLRDTVGTYNTTDDIQVDGGNFVAGTHTIEIITPIRVSPFGTFAGGTFFGARGVVLDNVAAGESNNYQVIDDAGNVVVEPIQVTFQITNVRTDTEVRIFNANTENEINGTESTTSQLSQFTVATAGSGYTVGDTLELDGGTKVTAAVLQVDATDGGGAITSASISNPGSGYSADPPSPTSHTADGVGGTSTTGTGATFNTTFTGSFVHQYTFTSNEPIFVVVFHLLFRDIRLVNLELTSSDQSIPVQQSSDRVYVNP